MITIEKIAETVQIVARFMGTDGKERTPSAELLRSAGLDVDVMEHAIRLTLDTASERQREALHTTPEIGLAIGVALAACYINLKRDRQSEAERDSFDAALGEGRR